MGSTREPLTFHSVVLSSAARKVLSQIGPYLEDRHFYLGGGTDLALYLGHRKSKDFDWFRKNPPVMIWSLDWKTVKKTIKAWVCEWYEKSRNTGHG